MVTSVHLNIETATRSYTVKEGEGTMIWGILDWVKSTISVDPEIIQITLTSLYISGAATLLSVLWSLPLGVFIGLKSFPGKRWVKGFFNALLGIPTVALGLFIYLLISSSGPFGFLNLWLTPLAIMIGQAILVTPIMVSFITSAVESIDPEIKDLARTLGASETQASLAVLRESTGGVFLAVTASFNRAIAELGVAMMLGGNIRGWTRVLTTYIALENVRANWGSVMAAAIILLSIVFAVSLSMNLIQRRKA